MAAEKKKLEKWKGKLNKNNFLILVLLGVLLLVAAWPVEKDKTVKSSQWDSESATIKETEKTEEDTGRTVRYRALPQIMKAEWRSACAYCFPAWKEWDRYR